jgi:hypothetical protein
MFSAWSATRKLVVLIVIASLASGSLAVALPLGSPENDDTNTNLKMYSDAAGTVELSKKNGAYVIIPGEIVYLQLTGLSDKAVMTKGTTADGETKVLIYYSRDDKAYSILFLEVRVLNGNSEAFPWTVGDFDADLVYDPSNPDDAEISCGATGVVIYGKVSSTSVFSILRASESAPDFVGYCGPADFVSDNSGSSSSSSTQSSQVSDYANDFCIARTMNVSVIVTDERYVNFVSCTVNGNVNVDNSRATFTNSYIAGDLDSQYSDLVVEGTTIGADFDIIGGSLRMSQTTIIGDLTCTGTDHVIISSTVSGIVSGCKLIGSLSTANLATKANYAPVLIGQIGDQSLYEEAILAFTVVASDANPGNTLTFSLEGAPTGASIDSSTGVFTWIPTEAQGPGTYTFDIVVTDNGNPLLSNRETITVIVLENTAPTLNAIGNKTVDELTTLTFTATATDPESPPQTLTYSLSGAPSGASINSSTGVFTWTPTEAQGPGNYSFVVIVSDSILLDSEIVTVTVNEVNTAPVLNSIGNKNVAAGSQLSFTATASDADVPSNTLTYSLSGAPSGASIDPSTGVFTWTPTEAQAGTHTFSVVVTDNGTPALSDSETITVTVNGSPVLDPIGNKTVDELTTLTFTATATDPNTGQTLTYSLSGAPSGASIDPSTGVFTWTPTEAQGPGNYSFDVIVTDNGSPALSDSETITVAVREVMTLTVTEGWDSKNGQTLSSLGLLDEVQASDNNRYNIDKGKWGSFQFTTVSFPGTATIQSVQIFIEHHEESGVDTGTIVWKAGQGTIQSPTTLITMTPALRIGSAAEGTDTFDVSSVIDTTTEVNNLILKIENNDDSNRTRIDYVYVIIKYTV